MNSRVLHTFNSTTFRTKNTSNLIQFNIIFQTPSSLFSSPFSLCRRRFLQSPWPPPRSSFHQWRFSFCCSIHRLALPPSHLPTTLHPSGGTTIPSSSWIPRSAGCWSSFRLSKPAPPKTPTNLRLRIAIGRRGTTAASARRGLLRRPRIAAPSIASLLPARKGNRADRSRFVLWFVVLIMDNGTVRGDLVKEVRIVVRRSNILCLIKFRIVFSVSFTSFYDCEKFSARICGSLFLIWIFSFFVEGFGLWNSSCRYERFEREKNWKSVGGI